MKNPPTEGQYDRDTQVLTVTEFELHNFLCCLADAVDDNGTGWPIVGVKIVPKHPQDFTPELQVKWEQKFKEMFELIHGMDTEYHDDAEYTC